MKLDHPYISFWGWKEFLPVVPHVRNGARRPPGDAASWCACVTDAVLGVVVDDLLQPRIHGLDPAREGEADAAQSAAPGRSGGTGRPKSFACSRNPSTAPAAPAHANSAHPRSPLHHAGSPTPPLLARSRSRRPLRCARPAHPHRPRSGRLCSPAQPCSPTPAERALVCGTTLARRSHRARLPVPPCSLVGATCAHPQGPRALARMHAHPLTAARSFFLRVRMGEN